MFFCPYLHAISTFKEYAYVFYLAERDTDMAVLSFRPAVCPSHAKDLDDIPSGSSRTVASNAGAVGKIGHFSTNENCVVQTPYSQKCVSIRRAMICIDVCALAERYSNVRTSKVCL